MSTETTETTRKPTCPCCCASERYSRAPRPDELPQASAYAMTRVRVCRKCDALYTPTGRTILLGDSYGLVRPQWDPSPENMDGARYFDFMTLGSEGLRRRHGWFRPSTRLLLQVG